MPDPLRHYNSKLMNAGNSDSLVWDEARLRDPHGQGDKSARVRSMFDAIAPSYERVNRLLSAGRDAGWRRAAVAMADIIPQDRVLDVACGTGDFARAFAAAGPAWVVGADFSGGMLARAAAASGPSTPADRRTSRRRPPSMTWSRGDALSLPFADESFTVVGCAFGIRNFQDLAAGLCEFHRVLRPGGRAVILEFSTPRIPLVRQAYSVYFRHVLPRVATRLSGDRTGAYRYLPRSVASFADGKAIRQTLESAGFAGVSQRSLTWGVVMVHLARKST